MALSLAPLALVAVTVCKNAGAHAMGHHPKQLSLVLATITEAHIALGCCGH